MEKRTQKQQNKIRFMKKGVKGVDGDYVPVWYHHCEKYGRKDPREVVVVYSKSYKDFPKGMSKLFNVVNNTDIVTDYFEKSNIVIEKSHSLFNHVLNFCK